MKLKRGLRRKTGIIEEMDHKKFLYEYIESLNLKWHQKLRIKLYDKFYWIKYFRIYR